MELIQVYASSPPSAIARAITGVVLEYHQAEVLAVGADAVDQAVQALALATNYLRRDGIFVMFVPAFSKVTVENKVRTAIKFVVKPYTNSELSFRGLSTNSSSAELPRV